MKVSILITAYNVEKYLAEAIESALNQTYSNIEIIAVNDGSTDNSLQVLQLYKDKIVIIDQENQGLSKALNIGLKRATGELITFLDGDDILIKDKLERQLKEFENNPDLEATFGSMEQFLSPDLIEYTDKFRFQTGKMEFKSKMTILIRSEAFKKYGLFPDIKLQDFIVWFDNAQSKGLIFNQTSDLVVYRRIRENSLSQSPDYYPQLLKYLKEKIRHKRVTV